MMTLQTALLTGKNCIALEMLQKNSSQQFCFSFTLHLIILLIVIEFLLEIENIFLKKLIYQVSTLVENIIHGDGNENQMNTFSRKI